MSSEREASARRLILEIEVRASPFDARYRIVEPKSGLSAIWDNDRRAYIDSGSREKMEAALDSLSCRACGGAGRVPAGAVSMRLCGSCNGTGYRSNGWVVIHIATGDVMTTYDTKQEAEDVVSRHGGASLEVRRA